jgi:hypothetical protein
VIVDPDSLSIPTMTASGRATESCRCLGVESVTRERAAELVDESNDAMRAVEVPARH